MKTVKKVIFPVAGLGTRFLPATKATPKEMLPIVDRPLIQYAVEEALAAGMTELIFVTSSNKRAIEDHFDCHYELEARLQQAGNKAALALVQNMLPKNVTVSYVRQAEPLGLGHAVYCAKALIGDEPFAVILADDLIAGQDCLQKMLQQCQKTGADGALAVQEVLPEKTAQYGIVAADQNGVITEIVEKPQPEQAPSNQAVIGRYVLPAAVFNALEQVKPGTGGEIQLTDAIALLLAQYQLQAYPLTAKRYDCGSKLGFLEATLDYALDHPELGRACKEYLNQRF